MEELEGNRRKGTHRLALEEKMKGKTGQKEKGTRFQQTRAEQTRERMRSYLIMDAGIKNITTLDRALRLV
jgi:hypothetical protein